MVDGWWLTAHGPRAADELVCADKLVPQQRELAIAVGKHRGGRGPAERLAVHLERVRARVRPAWPQERWALSESQSKTAELLRR